MENLVEFLMDDNHELEEYYDHHQNFEPSSVSWFQFDNVLANSIVGGDIDENVFDLFSSSSLSNNLEISEQIIDDQSNEVFLTNNNPYMINHGSVITQPDYNDSKVHDHELDVGFDLSDEISLLLKDNNEMDYGSYFSEVLFEHHDHQFDVGFHQSNEISSLVLNNNLHDEDQNQQQQQQEDDNIDGSPSSSSINSKSLMSERNRRKRMNQQLFTLRSLVPNITKMDRQSVLVDALAYLKSLLSQTQIEEEKISISSSPSLSDQPSFGETEHSPVVPCERPCAALRPAISKIEVELLVEERFFLKIKFNKALGAAGKIQRTIEMLGLDIINVSTVEVDEHNFESSSFVRVKRKGVKMTEQSLSQRVRDVANQLGLLLPFDF